ncbi:hypothetical protein J4221_02395 [Candidatus Pacearchaeota archaeon]|nr:hypothetical protein [Candidatus Pacearchaeota archaeon]
MEYDNLDPYDFARESNEYNGNYKWNFEEREREFDIEHFPIRSTLNLRRKYPK